MSNDRYSSTQRRNIRISYYSMALGAILVLQSAWLQWTHDDAVEQSLPPGDFTSFALSWQGWGFGLLGILVGAAIRFLMWHETRDAD